MPKPLDGGAQPPYQAKADYVALGRGALISWNMQTFRNVEDGEAEIAVDTWNPTDMDIDQWLDACVSAGMQYAILTVKAGGGFCLWPTAYHVGENPPYSIAQTTWYTNNGTPDIAALFVAKCRTRNLKPCFYYAFQDLTWESRSGETYLTDPSGYNAMQGAQLTELLSNYGDITAIWTDGWAYSKGYHLLPFAYYADLIHNLQPNCLLIDNAHQHPAAYSHIEEYETAIDGSIPSGNIRLAEEIKTIRANGKWYYNNVDGQTSADYTAAATILAAIAQANNNNAAYVLGLTPGTDGHLPASQATRLADLGA